MRNKSIFFRILLFNVGLQLFLRLYETQRIINIYGLIKNLLLFEGFGLLRDLVFSNVVILCLYPFFLFEPRYGIRYLSVFLKTILVVFALLHLIFLEYFLYQLILLDANIYQYSIREIYYTLGTADLPYLLLFGGLLIACFVLFLISRFTKWITGFKRFANLISIVIAVWFLFYFLIQFSYRPEQNKFIENKSYHFYKQSIRYLFRESAVNYSDEDALAFQLVHADKSYLSQKFPLLHLFEKKDVLGPHFNQFNKSPNIVFIIVEGLNDDFINDYHGIEWMPFLNELSSKSLYWNHCLTLGERSFAAVPSLIGSLPFGEKGFTLLNRYPLHQTLPSILKSNGYYTTFYYGQGAWFHQKDLFFKYNNLDLIFDNTCFHPKYSKIIVGSDQFFWGYNDKDLFSQSLEVIDTLSAKKRLDIYFTGSSHNPFVISNKLGYQEKYRALVKLKSNKDEKQFFKTYEKYLITLPFVDDAFKDLFSNYRKREDFQNTIFIITGDHPMTEVPIANSLKRYHVPLLIYSPKLKSAKVFTEVVSHLDVFETLLSYLDNYQIKIPKTSTALGGSLIVGEKMAEKKLAFMNDNREVVDYLKGDYYLTDDKLFKVSKGFEILPIEDKFIKNGMLAELLNYNKTRLYVSLKDALLPVLNFYQNHGFQNIKIFDSIMDIMGSNQYFDLIKELPIKNEKFHIHVSFDYEIPLGNNVQLIYQINSNKDSTIKWNSEGISPESAQYQHQFEIAKLPIDQNSLKLKLFIWNEKKEKIILKNFKILVYR